MISLEEKYYEATRFWVDGALEDPGNIERIGKTISLIPDDVKSLLDAGCGNGFFLNELTRQRPLMQVFGFDRSVEALKHVKAEKKTGDISNIEFPEGSFDCVCCLEVIEHLPCGVYEKALSELTRVAKRFVILSVPFNEDLLETFTQCPKCKSIFNANLHVRSFNKQSFAGLLEKSGYKCNRIELAGKSIQFKFHKEYRKIFYPSQFRKWLSPLCPICGYQEAQNEPKLDYGPIQDQPLKFQSNISIMNRLKNIPKGLWPKEERYYWIIGLFEKQNARNEK